MIERVAGIVLCGGVSRRMGTAKALLPFGPETMLQRVVRRLGEVVEPIVVVAAADQPLPDLPAGTLITRDERESRGPLEGLRVGLTALAGRAEAAYATSCDVPLLQPPFVRRMIQCWREADPPVDIAVPLEGRFHHPLAGVYRVSVTDSINRLLDADRLRPVFLFEDRPTRYVPVDELREVDPELETLANLNHPDDYRAALAAAGFTLPSSDFDKLTSSDGNELNR